MVDIFSTIIAGRFDEYLSAIDGADVNVKNDDGASLLHITIAYRRSDIAKDLLSRGVDINIKNREGMSPLISAIISKQFDFAKTLIQKGADINIRDQYGNDALWYAIGAPLLDYDLIRVIMDKGANPYEPNNVGRSAIDVAIQIGDPKLIDFLRVATSN